MNNFCPLQQARKMLLAPDMAIPLLCRCAAPSILPALGKGRGVTTRQLLFPYTQCMKMLLLIMGFKVLMSKCTEPVYPIFCIPVLAVTAGPGPSTPSPFGQQSSVSKLLPDPKQAGNECLSIATFKRHKMGLYVESHCRICFSTPYPHDWGRGQGHAMAARVLSSG